METFLCVNARVLHRFGQQICILRPAPRRLITTTTTMADYMLVLVLQKIFSLSGLLGENILLLCHDAEWKRIMDNWAAIFVFFLLCSFSSSTVCLYTVCKLYVHAPPLLLSFWWISSATYRPGVWTTVCWAVFSWSMWTQIFLERCRGRRGEDRLSLSERAACREDFYPI